MQSVLQRIEKEKGSTMKAKRNNKRRKEKETMMPNDKAMYN